MEHTRVKIRYRRVTVWGGYAKGKYKKRGSGECARCDQPRVPGQRYCRAHKNEYARLQRPKHSELTEDQRIRSNARAYANTYERRGKIERKPCETCGDVFAQKHHDDYEKPLEVRWLCRPCHLAEHQAETKMRESWPDETVRLLTNWAMWLINDKRPVGATSPYPAYKMASRGKRAGNVIPIISIEAEKADRIIMAMVVRYQQPLRMHYLWTMRSDRSKALACNCALDTYKARLHEAHAMFEREWYGAKRINPIAPSSISGYKRA